MVEKKEKYLVKPENILKLKTEYSFEDIREGIITLLKKWEENAGRDVYYVPNIHGFQHLRKHKDQNCITFALDLEEYLGKENTQRNMRQ